MIKMSQNLKKQEKSRFSKLKLKSTASTSKKLFSPKLDSQEKISKYFTSSQNGPEDEEVSNSENTKKVTPDSQNISLNDENDFAEQKSVKPLKVFEVKVQKQSKKKRTRSKNNLDRFLKDFGPSCSDTNQDHLQMALAMSKSLQEYENPGSESQDSEEYSSTYPSTQQKIATIKSTLDQFGFQSNRARVEIPNFKPNSKQRKKFKYITPTLFLRTDEDRKKLMETKVSAILSNIATYNKYLTNTESENIDDVFSNKPSSFLLRDFYDEDSSIFKLNNLSLSEMNDSKFYNKIVPKVAVKTGALLKNWGSIPGREKTPPRNIIVEETENEDKNSEKPEKLSEETEQVLLQNTGLVSNRVKTIPNIIIEETEMIECENSPINRSMSPELFSDTDFPLDNGKSPDKLSQNSQKSSSNDFFISRSPRIISSGNVTKEKSPIIVSSSSSNKIKTPNLLEKEILSDDSDAVSLSLLDNISPKRLKYRSPKKNKPSPTKKRLFSEDKLKSVSLLDDINPLKSTELAEIDLFKISSPIRTAENTTEICHFESFRDNSNDIFDLTRSSEESNEIKSQNDVPISEILFSTETGNEIGGHDDNTVILNQNKKDSVVKESEIIIDLTENSNESKKGTPQNNDLEETILVKYSEYCEEIPSSPFQNNISSPKTFNFNEENNSNDSIATVLLQDKYSPVIIKETQSISKDCAVISSLKPISINEENNSNDSVKTAILQQQYSSIIVEETPSVYKDCANISSSKSLNNNEETNSNDSVKTVLLQQNSSPNLIEEIEDRIFSPSVRNTILEENISKHSQNIIEDYAPISSPKHTNLKENYNNSLETLLLKKYNHSSDIIEGTEDNEVVCSKKNLDLEDDQEDLIETVPLQKNFEDEYSPEFDILNSSNNEEFYKSLDKLSSSSIVDSESFKKIKTNRKLKSRKSSVVRNISKNFKETEATNDRVINRSNRTMRKSYSENIIEDIDINKTDFFKLTSPLSITNCFTQPCLKEQILDIEENFQNFSDVEISELKLNKTKKFRKTKNINDISKSSHDFDSSDEEISKKVENKSKMKNRKIKSIHNSSQSSSDTSSEISDEELLYVSNISFKLKNHQNMNQSSVDISSDEENCAQENFGDMGNYMDINDLPYTGFEPSVNLDYTRKSEILKHPRVQDLETPKKLVNSPTKSISIKDNNTAKTPKNIKQINITPNNEYIIKTSDVTPMPNFKEMKTPELRKELDKYGIRPLKRAKGIKILQYIYEATHPILPKNQEKSFKSSSDEGDEKIIKKRRTNLYNQSRITENLEAKKVECIGNKIAESETLENMIFERKQSVKRPSCRLPLHIAWYNLVSSWQELHEKILLYEPIPVEQIYKKFKSFGYKYHIKDIIAFLDKKCINVTTELNEKRQIDDC